VFWSSTICPRAPQLGFCAIGFMFIGRHQPTASLPVCATRGMRRTKRYRGVQVEAINGDLMFGAVVRRMAKVALAFGFRPGRC
jgi:hypothetical protein